MPRKHPAPPKPPAPKLKPKPANAAKFGLAETGPLTLRLPLDLVAEIRATAAQRVQTPSQYLAWLHQQHQNAEAQTIKTPSTDNLKTQQTTYEPLPARAGSVTAVQIVADLLANPYPHDLMAIRSEVEREWGDEEVAREEIDAYCTHEAMMEARRKWTASQEAARKWLSSQNAELSHGALAPLRSASGSSRLPTTLENNS